MGRLESAEASDLPQRLLQVGLALIVFLFIPGLAHPFAVPKESMVALVAAFVLFVVAVGHAPRVAAWPWRWRATLLAPILLVTLAAVVNGTGLLASDGAVRFWSYAVFVLGVHLACPGAADAQRMIRFVALLGGVEGGLVLLQVLAGEWLIDFSGVPSAKWRAFGTLGNPNWVGAYLAATLPLVVALDREALTIAERVRSGLVTAATAAGLILTFSRGAWAAAGCGLVALFLLSPGVRRGRIMAMLAVAAGMAVIVAWASFSRGEVLEALARRASVAGRLRMWEATVAMVAARPLFGWAPGGFAGAYPAFQRAYVLRHGSDPPITDLTDHPHNDYLYLAAEAGVPALGAFLLLLVLVLHRARLGPDRNRSAPLAAAIVVLAAHALGDIPLHLPATTALFCVLLVGILAVSSEAPMERRLTWLPRTALVLIAALAVAQATRLLLVDRWLATARRMSNAGEPQRAEPLIRQGLLLDPAHGELWHELARVLVARGDSAGALDAAVRARAILPTPPLWYLIADLEQRRGRSEQAVVELRELGQTVPGLFRPRLLLAQAYADRGRVTEAKRVLTEALALPSKLPTDEERELRAHAARLLEVLRAE